MKKTPSMIWNEMDKTRPKIMRLLSLESVLNWVCFKCIQWPHRRWWKHTNMEEDDDMTAGWLNTGLLIRATANISEVKNIEILRGLYANESIAQTVTQRRHQFCCPGLVLWIVSSSDIASLLIKSLSRIGTWLFSFPADMRMMTPVIRNRLPDAQN